MSNFQVGDKVYFGSMGVKTLARVVKVNSKNLKLALLESRGSGRAAAVGSLWTVPSFMCWLYDASHPGIIVTQLLIPDAFKVGDKAYMGHPDGEKTLVLILKRNPTRYKVQLLEARGQHAAGTTFNAAPIGLTAVPADVPTPVIAPEVQAKAARTEAEIRRDIRNIYCGLSGENLTCDGELSRAQVSQRATALNARLRACFKELGREMSEGEAYGMVG